MTLPEIIAFLQRLPLLVDDIADTQEAVNDMGAGLPEAFRFLGEELADADNCLELAIDQLKEPLTSETLTEIVDLLAEADEIIARVDRITNDPEDDGR